MTTKFVKHVAVATGGSTGIGFSIAQALIAQDAKRVYSTGRTAKTLHAAATQLGQAAVAVVSGVF